MHITYGHGLIRLRSATARLLLVFGAMLAPVADGQDLDVDIYGQTADTAPYAEFHRQADHFVMATTGNVLAAMDDRGELLWRTTEASGSTLQHVSVSDGAGNLFLLRKIQPNFSIPYTEMSRWNEGVRQWRGYDVLPSPSYGRLELIRLANGNLLASSENSAVLLTQSGHVLQNYTLNQEVHKLVAGPQGNFAILLLAVGPNGPSYSFSVYGADGTLRYGASLPDYEVTAAFDGSTGNFVVLGTGVDCQQPLAITAYSPNGDVLGTHGIETPDCTYRFLRTAAMLSRATDGIGSHVRLETNQGPRHVVLLIPSAIQDAVVRETGSPYFNGGNAMAADLTSTADGGLLASVRGTSIGVVPNLRGHVARLTADGNLVFALGVANDELWRVDKVVEVNGLTTVLGRSPGTNSVGRLATRQGEPWRLVHDAIYSPGQSFPRGGFPAGGQFYALTGTLAELRLSRVGIEAANDVDILSSVQVQADFASARAIFRNTDNWPIIAHTDNTGDPLYLSRYKPTGLLEAQGMQPTPGNSTSILANWSNPDGSSVVLTSDETQIRYLRHDESMAAAGSGGWPNLLPIDAQAPAGEDASSALLLYLNVSGSGCGILELQRSTMQILHNPLFACAESSHYTALVDGGLGQYRVVKREPSGEVRLNTMDGSGAVLDFVSLGTPTFSEFVLDAAVGGSVAWVSLREGFLGDFTVFIPVGPQGPGSAITRNNVDCASMAVSSTGELNALCVSAGTLRWLRLSADGVVLDDESLGNYVLTEQGIVVDGDETLIYYARSDASVGGVSRFSLRTRPLFVADFE